jgi:hypothetical protein
MRFMLMVKADRNSEAGVMPSREMLTAMGKFNEELVKAGVMLAGEGLQPSSKGARVRFSSGGRSSVTDGPFAATGELVAGFWLWQVKSRDEAIAWSQARSVRRRCRGRDLTGIRSGGFRRRIDARTSRTRRALARAHPETRRVAGHTATSGAMRVRCTGRSGGNIVSPKFLRSRRAPGLTSLPPKVCVRARLLLQPDALACQSASGLNVLA